MFEKRLSLRTTLAAMTAVAALCLFSSCAGKGLKPADPVTSDVTSLLDESEQLAANATDATPFNDLQGQGDGSVAATTVSDGSAYYDAVGGEDLASVAIVLYGKKSAVKKLLELNPDLKGASRLAAGQRIYFDLETARPKTQKLTKALLSRYPEKLAERIRAMYTEQGVSEDTVTVNPGEGLKAVAWRLYGNKKYWTELYLLNRDKVQNFDTVEAGATLSIYSHPKALPVVKTVPQKELPPAAPAPMVSVPVVSPMGAIAPSRPEPIAPSTPPTVMSSQGAAVNIQPSAPPSDPIPETSAPTSEPSPAIQKVENIDQPPEGDPGSDNASMRRILYVALVLLIGGGAFYATRPKKKKKFDMLDVTTNDTVQRPKLPPKNTQRPNIG